MAYTALPAADDLVNTAGLVIAPADAIDAVNGNKYPHTDRSYVLIHNADDVGTATVAVKVQRALKEDGQNLSIEPVSIDIGPEDTVLIGGFSASNFRNADGDVELDWTFSGGAAAGDVTVQHMTL